MKIVPSDREGNGTFLSGRQIILLSDDPSGTWINLGTASTSANSFYSFTVARPPRPLHLPDRLPRDNVDAISCAGSGVNVSSQTSNFLCGLRVRCARVFSRAKNRRGSAVHSRSARAGSAC